VNRQPLPKDDAGGHWHWKDLNVGINIAVYGKVFHLYDCDKFTKVYILLVLHNNVLKCSLVSEENMATCNLLG